MKTNGIKRQVVSLLGFAFLMAVAGCGGGGSSTAAAPSGVSKGVITALGSIFVNGVEFSVSSSKITSNKSTGSSSDLRVGRVVTVRGGRSDDLHGSATEVEYKDNLSGPLDLAPAGGTSSLQVLGQTVLVDTTSASVAAGKTVLVGFSSLSQLSANSVLEVSGLPDASGIIHATYLELKGPLAANTSVEIKGAIANLNTTAKTFTINALTVNYGSAALNDLSGTIANGMFVEVKGTGAGYTGGANPVLIATKLENEREDAEGDENHNLAVEGFVSGFTAGSNSFKVSGQSVNTGSLSLTGIGNNVRVEVEGSLVNGILVATKIKLDS